MARTAILLFSALGLIVLAAGCNGDRGVADAAGDGEPVLADSDDVADEGSTDESDGDLPNDIDLGKNLGLWIPADARACVLGLPRALEEQLWLKSRISFKPGMVVLRMDLNSFEAELIERVELTPGRGDPLVSGPGVFTRTVTGSPELGTVEYRFEQPFLVGGREFYVGAAFVFDVEGGAVKAPLKVLDLQGTMALLARDPNWLKAGFVGGDEMGLFLSCAPQSSRTNEYEFKLANGATLLLQEWMTEVPGWWLMCAAGLARLTYSQGQTVVVVDDYWRLAYRPGNHNIIENFAVRFEPPLGEVAGLQINTQSLGLPLAKLSSIFTLDAKLATSGELAITAATYRGVPCGMAGP